jgi:hypothetical protein
MSHNKAPRPNHDILLIFCENAVAVLRIAACRSHKLLTRGRDRLVGYQGLRDLAGVIGRLAARRSRPRRS